ncbi:glutamate receptor 2.2-like [Neltuma alba]|uniref:glutamate receptor 2.2-like n=1 Tax=Neltuma alba TaxID=207710 RepID=UPI0010A3E117|nr:glutamate receptor 2.2-like [Prosopis alba]
MQAAYYLMKKVKVRALLGPQNSEQARYIVRLGELFQVPVIWFPITGPSLLPPPSPSSIYIDQGLDCYQFQAIAASLKAFGWQSIVPIYEETEYGSHLVPCLTNVLKEMGIRMANVTAITSDSSDLAINITLNRLNNMRTHVFLVHMSMDLGTTFVLSAQRKEMMGEGYAWILTQELSSLTDPQVTVKRNLYTGQVLSGSFTDFFALKRYMQGALGVRPMDSNKTDVRKGIENNFTAKFGGASLTIYGWWAYHTIEALAMALEKPGADNNGTKLRSEILATNFTGVSGINFNLKGGQLDQSVLEVYNVVGTRERIIGSWNPKDGFVQNNSKSGEVSGDGYQLSGPLALWPGDTLDKPPKLRIGVPRTNSFPEFVNVDNSSKHRIDGFAIHVFLKAIGHLPFLLNNYEFVPLPKKSDTPTNYDDILCSQMKDEDLDAIIGDITIVAKRTNCVDFTLPYLDSSVAMVPS